MVFSGLLMRFRNLNFGSLLFKRSILNIIVRYFFFIIFLDIFLRILIFILLLRIVLVVVNLLIWIHQLLLIPHHFIDGWLGYTLRNSWRSLPCLLICWLDRYKSSVLEELQLSVPLVLLTSYLEQTQMLHQRLLAYFCLHYLPLP